MLRRVALQFGNQGLGQLTGNAFAVQDRLAVHVRPLRGLLCASEGQASEIDIDRIGLIPTALGGKGCHPGRENQA